MSLPPRAPESQKGTLDSWVLAVDIRKIVEELREKQIGCCAKKLQMWTQPRRDERTQNSENIIKTRDKMFPPKETNMAQKA